mgnify:CR=1 FL=1
MVVQKLALDYRLWELTLVDANIRHDVMEYKASYSLLQWDITRTINLVATS